MDENTNEVLGGEVIESEFEDWSDIDTSNLIDEGDGSETSEPEEEAADEADKPAPAAEPEEKEDKPEDKPEAEQKSEEQAPDQEFELKHLDEVRKVNRQEVIELAQKGMDYDRIRGKLEELRGVEAQASENESYAEFVKELADGAGISVEELIDGTRARILMDKASKEGRTLSQADAMQSAKQTREAKASAQQTGREAKEARSKQERFTEEANRFRTLFPDVKGEDIPGEVWQDYDKGGNLVDAWNKHQNQQLRSENEKLHLELDQLKQEHKNEQRSTGSRKSAGASSKSAVDDAWEAALKSDW